MAVVESWNRALSKIYTGVGSVQVDYIVFKADLGVSVSSVNGVQEVGIEGVSCSRVG